MNIRNLLLLAFLFLGMLFCSSTQAEGEIVRDIILINGVAELVDLTPSGDIVERHVVIEDYFSSGRSHDRSLRHGLDKLNIFGNLETQKENRIVYDTPVVCRQSLMAKDAIQSVEEISTQNFHPENIKHSSELHYQSLKVSSSELLSSHNFVLDIASKRQRLIFSTRWYGTERVLTTSYKTSKASNDV